MYYFGIDFDLIFLILRLKGLMIFALFSNRFLYFFS